ncbi:hypothetical protein ACN08Y_10190 [Rothia sp. P5764]|uniref:hypothetical protein n=1 Tax=Rothia sp. P5764 TaxID=3402654 RepID=UPI003AC47DE0
MGPTFFPSEAWSLFSVAITAGGALVGALVTAWVQRGKNRADASLALVDNLQEEVKRLRAEVDELREKTGQAYKEMYQAQSEAFAMKDIARLHISLSTAYIYQLRAHIDTGQGPPAPAIPDDLAELMTPKPPA